MCIVEHYTVRAVFFLFHNFPERREERAQHSVVGYAVVKQRRALVALCSVDMILPVLLLHEFIEIEERRLSHDGQSFFAEKFFVACELIVSVKHHRDLRPAGAVVPRVI